MTQTQLREGDLHLLCCTAELLRAEGDDRARFGALLDAAVPESWPPELYDDDARRWTLNVVESAPETEGWWMYYLVRDAGDAPREVIGVGGYKSPPDATGTVEIGYGVVPEQRRRGYASMAVRALLRRAFAFPEVDRVTAETLPELAPSIGVLEKAGFTLAEGEGSEPGVIRFELPRDRWKA